MDLQDSEQYFKALRDAQQNQYDMNVNLLNAQRQQAQQNIMSTANRAGVLYSNFPQRQKILYDTNTYMPAFTKLRTSYLTGLDTLRNKGTDLANSIRATQDAIADLNNDIL